MLDMYIENYSFKKRYGGNIRVIIGNKNKKWNYNNIVLNEKKFFKKLIGFKKFIIKWKKNTLKIITKLKKKYIIVGKAFPGRASVLINILNLNSSHVREIYEKPTSPKIGNYVPNTRIPIVSDKKLSSLKKEVIIINFAWHIKKEIHSYLNNKGLKNKIIDIL
jgi:hypothetical protein